MGIEKRLVVAKRDGVGGGRELRVFFFYHIVVVVLVAQ